MVDIPDSENGEMNTFTKETIANHFIQIIRNNVKILVKYDPLEIESSLRGRLKFMAAFKQRFTKEEIVGIFKGIFIKDNSKTIKRKSERSVSSLDYEDLLLKNFRKFGDLY